MKFNKKTFVVPSGTNFEESVIVTKGDAVIADRTFLNYGIITDKRIFVGERVKISGMLCAKDDIRIDMWSEIMGDVLGAQDIYLADKVKVLGKVSAGKDFDVGDNVSIEKGFEAKGWVNIRSPIPLVIYIFIYILELLRQGRSKEVDAILDELEASKGENYFMISDEFFFLPRDSVVAQDRVKIIGSCRVGNRCRITGNFYVTGNVKIGAGTELYGSLKAGGDVEADSKVIFHGDLECKGNLKLGSLAQVIGNVTCGSVELFRSAIIQGTLRAQNYVRFRTPYDDVLKEKVERFKLGVDSTENILGI
ncbi:MAG: polymer-forming cytoskeletal protein [Candidatus Thermoplasmatota archaeon]|nr:polymer-forming cytoskeletal protein [Candidatus Thermoplasmatota archaeon]MDI6887913.1 polymer-forming cytoskeletal protein [Candidatus Thermoplasmatota archaeon]